MKTKVTPRALEKKKELPAEARRATRMLSGKTVKKVWRHRAAELGIEFDDGSRLFIDPRNRGLEITIT